MNQFFVTAAFCSLCAALPLGCAAQAETPDTATAATAPANDAPITAPLTITTPNTGASIVRNTTIMGIAKPGGAGVKVKVEIQPASGTWFDMGTVDIAPGGKWSVPGFFGADDTPLGSMFQVRAQLLDNTGKVLETQLSTDLKKADVAANANTNSMMPSTAKEIQKPVIMGYFPSYQTALTAEQVPTGSFTHVIYSFLKVNDAGILDPESWAAAPAIARAVHAKGIKFVLALSGGSNGKEFAAMVRDPAKNRKFLDSTIDVLKKCDADGIALDWEQPEESDKALTTALISNLHTKMKAANPNAILVLVVNHSAWNSKGYDGPKLVDKIDYLQVMSYDFHGPWSSAGHQTSLFASKTDADFTYPKTLQYWHETQGFPLDKILMGIAGYGRGFKAANWGDKTTGESKYPEISYRDLDALIGKGWTREWDAEAHAPWLLSTDKTDRISYDDPQSVADKAAWMKQSGMPGFFIWEMSQEYMNGGFALTNAAHKAWMNAK